MNYFKYVILAFYLVLTLVFSFALNAKVMPPINVNINNVEFTNWLDQYKEKATVIDELLYSAGIEKPRQVYLNGLVVEASPYLLRHAVNPINWQAWSDKALNNAKQKNKLIFLSIGYSTCHWCHVMEKESFVDIEVAEFLNQNFINLKVDRELQPAVDAYFTEVLTTVKGSAGWPITAILTPDAKPIWIDSYVSKSDLLKISARLVTIWEKSPKRLEQVATNITQQVTAPSSDNNAKWSLERVTQNISDTLNQLDVDFGGLPGAPKFPSEALLLLSLEQYKINPSNELKKKLVVWLDNLSQKGIRDHVHGGFHRYATDAFWQLPHYEKMLYNQALLIQVFARASHLLERPDYLDVAIDTLEFATHVMRSPEGGYYSAIDADYQNQEGGYYLFSRQDKALLSKEIKDAFLWYQFKDKELFAPYLRNSDLPPIARNTLRESRESLPLPHIDKKILLSWNALFVDALIELYFVTSEHNYLKSAEQLIEYLEDNLIVQGALKRAVYLDTAGGDAALEDYTYLAQVYDRMYIATFNNEWRNKTKSLLHNIIGDQKLNKKILNVNDGELISVDALFLSLSERYRYSDSVIASAYRKHKKDVQKAYLRAPISAFSVAKVFSSAVHPVGRASFAQGNGMISIEGLSDTTPYLTIELKPGWHINSNSPNQASLLATSISIDGSAIDSSFYPQPIEKKLGFSEQPLSLFDEKIKVRLPSYGSWLTLELQACSEQVCLLPESFTFKL
ncbi:thioredoxin domain-containing protein [Pseudoalteromonas sp. XMcav1-K]|uniref:thioredoxin domain-containing protein n=1 Tax=Pseudoalteromonas sp. XMcav1-K TaxID=3374372 RepID=UPI00375731DF